MIHPRNFHCTPSQSRLHPALDGRQFQERWESEYIFVLQGEKTVFILCYEAMSVVKEYSLRRHFDTKHRDKYAKFSLQEKLQIVQELKGGLQSQQNIFTKATAKNYDFTS